MTTDPLYATHAEPVKMLHEYRLLESLDSTAELTVSKSATLEEILPVLIRWGVVLIPEYLSHPDLSGLMAEAGTVFEIERPWIDKLGVSPPDQSRCVHRERMDNDELPITSRVFNYEYLRRITNRYLGPPNIFNDKI